ncbi:MAG TPA: type II secretion system protein GspK [Rhodoblastus sp.]|nr:type II secretion system protein GspK [Rhodoblastus sp.]
MLLVIWGLGAIALLVLSFLTTGRLRLQAAFNIAGAAQAGSVAAAAIDLSLLQLARERSSEEQTGPGAPATPTTHDGAPRFCALEDAVVAVAVEDESGKVDLNTAPEDLLRELFSSLLGAGPAQADDLARAVMAFRAAPENDLPEPPAADGKPFGPKRAPFQTTLELDQIAGLDSAAFHALLPFVTVYSHSGGIDPQVAPPALIAALLGAPRDEVAGLAATPFPNAINRDDPRFPSAFRQSGARTAFLVHAETILANGPGAAQERIVEMDSNDGAPFAVREIRHGVSRYLDLLRPMRGKAGALPPC